jgi:hypothetical protein
MDPLITAAARVLAAGDPLRRIEAGRLARRRSALALRGIVMASKRIISTGDFYEKAI